MSPFYNVTFVLIVSFVTRPCQLVDVLFCTLYFSFPVFIVAMWTLDICCKEGLCTLPGEVALEHERRVRFKSSLFENSKIVITLIFTREKTFIFILIMNVGFYLIILKFWDCPLPPGKLLYPHLNSSHHPSCKDKISTSLWGVRSG